ncbi:MAG: HlyD family efflux transporter periplasmic adaptor subunit [Pseudomonadota bacterium]
MPFRERHIRYFKTLDSIKTPKIIRVVARMLCVLVFAIAAFLIFTPWVQTTAGTGLVTALDPNDRPQEINALVSGRIEQWFVRDGSVVAAGDPILKIADNDPRLIERLTAEQQQLLNQRNAAASALATGKLDLRRIEQLLNEGLAAPRDLEQARIRIDGLRSSLAAAEAALTRQQVDISRQSQQLLRAPRDGTILRLNAGDSATTVTVGDPVATFQPDEAIRVVELYLDGRDVALVHTGSPVRLVFEGWPAVQFSGWPSVAIGAFDGVVVAVDPVAQANGQFRVLVAEDEDAEIPWPDERFIRFGAAARGWVLLNRVSLGYELWRQLNNFPPEFVEQAQGGAAQP